MYQETQRDSLLAKFKSRTDDDFVPEQYHTQILNDGNLPEYLAQEIKFWTARNPVFIEAPTGSGKSTFVLDKLLPAAVEENKNILILSNRTALSTQQKMLLLRKINSPLLRLYTEEGIAATERFDNVGIVTYQGLLSFLNNKNNTEWLSDVIYAVADEAHFFAADSLFNEKCHITLREFVSKFKNAIRIYQTATPWEVLVPIAEAEVSLHDFERQFNGFLPPREITRYVFKGNFGYVKLNFFDSFEDIIAKIEESLSQKWLIFVDSKMVGADLARRIGENASFVEASSKQTTEWKEIVKNSKFSKQVLITTSVLDCGVNIWDSTLINMVICTDNRTSLIQMLGRKRRNKDERFNVYIQTLDMKRINYRTMDYLHLVELCNRYNQGNENREKLIATIWNSDDSRLRKLFYLSHGALKINKICEFVVRKRYAMYRSLSQGESSFEEMVCRWLGLSHTESAEKRQQLVEFCEMHLGYNLNEDEVVMVRKLVVEACEESGFREPQVKRIESLKREALNNRFEKMQMPYLLARDSWKIEIKE